MRVYHITKRRLGLWALSLVLLGGAALLLAGCFGGEEKGGEGGEAGIVLSSEAQQVEYLAELGWMVISTPMETLDMRLPEELTGEWAQYAALQEPLALPFADYAGQAVRRYTYAVINYPQIPSGVQANLYLCGDQLIGGDIIFTGQGGFRADLRFPTAQ